MFCLDIQEPPHTIIKCAIQYIDFLKSTALLHENWFSNMREIVFFKELEKFGFDKKLFWLSKIVNIYLQCMKYFEGAKNGIFLYSYL